MQLEQMSLLIGDDDYETFIRCAQTGVDRRSEAGARRGLHNDHLSRALYGLNGDDQSEAKAVAWGIMLGIINMLDDCEYEYVVRSATKALRMIPEAVAAR